MANGLIARQGAAFPPQAARASRAATHLRSTGGRGIAVDQDGGRRRSPLASTVQAHTGLEGHVQHKHCTARLDRAQRSGSGLHTRQTALKRATASVITPSLKLD